MDSVPSIPRKYYIRSMVSRMSQDSGVPKRILKRQLAGKMGISESHLNRITNYRIGQDKSMTSDQLVIAADFFGVQIDDLINPVYREKHAGTKKAPQEEA